jgi:hypothetical protein
MNECTRKTLEMLRASRFAIFQQCEIIEGLADNPKPQTIHVQASHDGVVILATVESRVQASTIAATLIESMCDGEIARETTSRTGYESGFYHALVTGRP